MRNSGCVMRVQEKWQCFLADEKLCMGQQEQEHLSPLTLRYTFIIIIFTMLSILLLAILQIAYLEN